ncbi:hypothetical protein BG004_004123 [Podila humilis]|nr:hypothetical protein BG004_004123 [Podila humilis]
MSLAPVTIATTTPLSPPITMVSIFPQYEPKTSATTKVPPPPWKRNTKTAPSQAKRSVQSTPYGSPAPTDPEDDDDEDEEEEQGDFSGDMFKSPSPFQHRRQYLYSSTSPSSWNMSMECGYPHLRSMADYSMDRLSEVSMSVASLTSDTKPNYFPGSTTSNIPIKHEPVTLSPFSDFSIIKARSEEEPLSRSQSRSGSRSRSPGPSSGSVAGRTTAGTRSGTKSGSMQLLLHCPVCDRAFKASKNQNCNLRRHLKNVHDLSPAEIHPRKCKWDSLPDGRVKDDKDRKERTRKSKRMWARKFRLKRKVEEAAEVLTMLGNQVY